MLIVGDISGIQDYLFDVAHHGGGQARRLRARSFFLQMLPEIAAYRIRTAAGLDEDKLIVNAAGKFVILADGLTSEGASAVAAEGVRLEKWLREHVGARLRFTLIIDDCPGTPEAQHLSAQSRLHTEKLRPWRNVMIGLNGWNHKALVLESITPLCHSCHRQTAVVPDQKDSDVRVCHMCAQDYEMGQLLPRSHWLAMHSQPTAGLFDIAGVGVSLHAEYPGESPDAECIFSLSGALPHGKSHYPTVIRNLARHVPLKNSIPLDFDEIAALSEGAPYLGVLKMDVDSLGDCFRSVLHATGEWRTLSDLSARLDRFFAVTLNNEAKRSPWDQVYTVFAGGDDLIVIGPWNVLFDYAANVRSLFQIAFHREGLTLSAGLAMVRPKFPIRRAVEQAEQALERAKQVASPGQSEAKDQMAALGQIWKWEQHEGILFWAKQLTGWVAGDAAQRGWLHTLLRFDQQRLINPLATARLEYHITRNYPRSDDRDPAKRALRSWIDKVAGDFDSRRSTNTPYLPTILRYALTATRAESGDKDFE